MAKAIALTRIAFEREHTLELARGVVVSACALALVAAGQAFPFI